MFIQGSLGTLGCGRDKERKMGESWKNDHDVSPPLKKFTFIHLFITYSTNGSLPGINPGVGDTNTNETLPLRKIV